MLLAVGMASYANSFRGVFLFDDNGHIVNNPQIRSLWPFGSGPVGSPYTRAAVTLTLAVNYAISGTETWSYHAVNLAIHLAAGLTLFGLVRRTLLSPKLRERFGSSSLPLAAVCAAVWLVHPLQTSAVTYVIQRGESLMGLMYLLTLYALARGDASRRRWAWYAASVAACAVGMTCKPVMATAPILALAYDRVFLAGSLREAFRRRAWVYVGLGATWAVLVGLMLLESRFIERVDAGLTSPKGLDYLQTQGNVVLHYLRLCFWPDPLVFDYGWPTPRNAAEWMPGAAVILLLLLATGVALFRRPAAGFLGLWFFGILSVTSSFVPLADAAFEHRMYLPSAAVIVASVLAAWMGGRRLLDRLKLSEGTRRTWGWSAGILAAGLAIATLGVLTFRRNVVYADVATMWVDTAGKRPHNERALGNAGLYLYRKGQLDQAEKYLEQALVVNPRYALAHGNLALLLAHRNHLSAAIRHLEAASRLDPGNADTLNTLGVMQARNGRLEDAIRSFRRALEADQGYSDARTNLERALQLRAASSTRPEGASGP